MTAIKVVSITLCIRDLIVCCFGFPLNERLIYSQAFNQPSLPENLRRGVKKSNKLSVRRGTDTRRWQHGCSGEADTEPIWEKP